VIGAKAGAVDGKLAKTATATATAIATVTNVEETKVSS
jgi:hypothetical protein